MCSAQGCICRFWGWRVICESALRRQGEGELLVNRRIERLKYCS